MGFNDYIITTLPGAVQSQLRVYATTTPNVSRFFDPATAWFYTGTVCKQISLLLNDFAVAGGLANWLILADQPYPLTVQKRYADILIADPSNQTHYILMEVTASMNIDDALGEADKLADYMENNPDLYIDAYVFFLAIDEQMLQSGIQSINAYIQANYDVNVTPIGTTP